MSIFSKPSGGLSEKRFPDAELSERDGLVVLHGYFPAHGNDGYEIDLFKLRIVFPSNYPERVPTVFVTDKRISAVVERHVFAENRSV